TNIFDPAGMKNTQVVTTANASTSANEVIAYVRKSMLTDEYARPDEFPAFHFLISLGNVVGDGSIHSCVDDLVKWDRALYSEKILKNKTLKEAFTPISKKASALSTPLSSAAWSYGMGWFIRPGEQSTTEVWHTGGKPGVATYLIRNIGLDQTIIILANTSSSAVVDAGNAIDGILAGRAYRLPKLSV